MTSSSVPSGVDLVDSMSVVEFDVDGDRFRASYDSDRDSAPLAVVAVISTVLDRDPLALPPLYGVADVGPLEDLSSGPSDDSGDPQRTAFRYEGFDVTVSGDTVEAVPRERPSPSP